MHRLVRGGDMSKIGRKAIELGGVQVEIKGQEIRYKGSKDSGVRVLPQELVAKMDNGKLFILANESYAKKIARRDLNRVWGLERALVSNEIRGADKLFERKVIITGLGFKAIVSGKNLLFSLGYSHKIDFPLPEGVTVDIDKTGQLLTVKSTDKLTTGQVASDIRALRETEPYKGTGIKLEDDIIIRKAGKAKSS
jgi:large subunit ribosomal protein L6